MTGRTERAKFVDAVIHGRDRRDEIRAEWEALKMAPRIQSPEELRRVLMTWTKKDLVTFVIRAESDAIKARARQLEAWAEAQHVHETALILPRESKQHEVGHADPFNVWLINHKGQTLDARDVFKAGWSARARADEAIDKE